MRTSSLAERLEEFERDVAAMETPQRKPSQLAAVDDSSLPRRAPRLSFTSRRIRIRESGLRHFRVF